MSDYNGEEKRQQHDLSQFRDAVAEAIVIALKKTANDPDFCKAFWHKGYLELAEHSSNGASQWLGKKLLVWAATAMVASLIVWLVKTGAVK